jgi:hypothetical protein
MLAARRATLRNVLRPFALGLGGSALYAASDLGRPSARPQPGPSAPAPTFTEAALVVAASAPLFGVSALGVSSCARGLSGMRWLSRGWERVAWTGFFACSAALALGRPAALVARLVDASEEAAGAERARLATRAACAVAGASVLATVVGERLGSYFGAALLGPSLVGSLAAAVLMPDVPLASLAPAPALVIPLLLLTSAPAFTRSADLLLVALWTVCATVPTLAELYAPPPPPPPLGADGELSGKPSREAAKLAFEQLAAACAVFCLNIYLLRRRPLCQY